MGTIMGERLQDKLEEECLDDAGYWLNRHLVKVLSGKL